MVKGKEEKIIARNIKKILRNKEGTYGRDIKLYILKGNNFHRIIL